jgi:uncharacterized protein YciI
MRDVRFVIFHTPGPTWVHGKSMFDQDGVHAHVGHYRALCEQGKLELGGPFLDAAAGGMMIATAGVSRDEAAVFANTDPAVASGLLRAEVREWLIGMRK